MKKKNIKVKKGNGDISITIENNLNANNKQINHQPIKRKRRKKKVEDTEEINEVPNIPLKDVSYIKPGPIGNFKVWRDTMDSYNTTVPMNQAQQLGLVPPRLPAPEPTSALPAPEQQQMLTFDNWQRAMTMMREQQQPPVSWGRELIDDDDEPIMPASPVFSTMSKPNYLEDDIDFAKELDNSVAEVYGLDPNHPETKQTSKEVQQILNKARFGVATSQAKRLGTLHGNKKLLPQNIRKSESYMKYKDTTAYKMAYEKAFNTIQQEPQDLSEIQEEEPPRTRRSRSVRMSENVTNRSRDRERERIQRSRDRESEMMQRSRDREREGMQREIEQLNQQMPDFGDFENFDVDTELARAGLTRIVEF